MTILEAGQVTRVPFDPEDMMPTANEPITHRQPWRIPAWLGLCLFLAIAAFFLWEEHRAHLLGAVPYVLLMLCPVIHLFMHRGHGGHAGHGARRSRRTSRRPWEGVTNHDVPAYGLWSLVLINAAVFILFAFSFFKPKTARDWRT